MLLYYFNLILPILMGVKSQLFQMIHGNRQQAVLPMLKYIMAKSLMRVNKEQDGGNPGYDASGWNGVSSKRLRQVDA